MNSPIYLDFFFYCYKIQKNVQNNHSNQIKCLQIDWGGGRGEFRLFTIYLAEQGTEFRHPCPYNHHQNGRIERHIVETGSPFLHKLIYL